MIVRTVLGDVSALELGVCYAHEHIIIERSYTTERTPDFLLDSVEAAVLELGELRGAGCERRRRFDAGRLWPQRVQAR